MIDAPVAPHRHAALPARLRSWAASSGPRWYRLACTAALLWAVGWLAALLLAPEGTIQGRFVDAGVYYLAGHAFLHGQNYYATPDFRQWPLVAAAWSPFTVAPYPIVLRLWLLLTVAGVAAGFAALLRRVQREGNRPNGRWTLLVVLGPPTLMMLYLGQMSGLCFAAYALGVTLLDRHPRLAGCAFALMAAKPHLALLAVPALLAAPLSAGVAFALALLVWPVGSLLVAGPGVFHAFLVQVLSVRDTNVGLVTSSLSSLLPLRGPAHSAVQAGLIGIILVFWLVLATARLRRRRIAPPLQDVAAVLTLLALPYALVSDLLFVTPLLFRRGTAPEWRDHALLVAWWVLPWLAVLLTGADGGGIAALLPLLAVFASLATSRVSGAGERMSPPRPLPAHRDQETAVAPA